MLLGILLLVSCASQNADTNTAEKTEAITPSVSSKEPGNHKDVDASQPKVIILGDSITAGLNLPVDSTYPTLLGRRFSEQGLSTEFINSGISGDTTAGGLRRTDWLLKQNPDLLVIQLGANDGLRNIALTEIEANLEAIIEKAKASDTEIMLVQMKIPGNYGQEYTEGFISIFPRLAQRHQISLLPFLLEDVAGDRKKNQADGIHPTKEGHQQMAERMYEPLRIWREGWQP